MNFDTKDHLVYLRIFEGCNLHCEHCFIPSNPKKINLDFFNNKNIGNVLIESGKIDLGSNIYIQWHGGEPTSMGVDYLESAISKINEDERFSWKHGIQTNLINFNKDTLKWVSFYKKYFDSHVGVSWDYKIRHTKTNSGDSLDESSDRYENIFWKNVSLANDNDLDLYMVVTVNKLFFERYRNPFEFYEFIYSKGIRVLNFERITKTGYARDNWAKLGLSNKEYSEYMSKFFKHYILFNNADPRLSISPFDGLMESVSNIESERGYGCWSGHCDTHFHTIDSSGYKFGCTAINSEVDNKKSVNVISFVKSYSKKADILEARSNRVRECKDCTFQKICSSGCLSIEKFDNSGECSGGYKLYEAINEYLSK